MRGKIGDAGPAAVPPPSIAAYDSLLGYIPNPNLRGLKNYDATVTTDAAGIRRNGPGPPPSGSAVLAIGDSFTFGLEVNDDESWPAQLERRLKRPVVNAGVFGYGIDQIVLRGEALVKARPDVGLVILAAYAGDIMRCEYSYLFGPKPYFTVSGGRLELQNVPVPNGFVPAKHASLRDALRRHSQLAYLVLRRVLPRWWLIGDSRHEHDHGDEVASLLLAQWSQFARERRVQTLYVALVALSPGEALRLNALTTQARREGLEVLDLSDTLSGMIRANRAKWQKAAGHLTREGNDWVAAQIAQRLASFPAGATN